MPQAPLIALDQRVPFVNAIFEIVAGRDTYDKAIALLVRAETQYGLRIIYDGVTGSRALGLMPIEGFEPSMQELLNVNADLDLLWTHYREASHESQEIADRTQLFPFISETSFLIGGTDFANDHLIQFSSGLLCSWTQRAWGSTLAEWANTTDWMQPYRSLWEGDFGYTIFCYYLYQIVDRYEPWVETVQKVIQLKCAQQLAEEAEQH